MERLGGEVKKELSRFGAPGGMPEVLEAWSAAVGEMVAANAWPARIARDGTLHVNTSSSSWAFELGQLAPAILGRLREKLGESVPQALRFAPGHLPEAASPTDRPARTETPRPSAEALQRAADLASGIADPELRKRVARAAALGLAGLPSDIQF